MELTNLEIIKIRLTKSKKWCPTKNQLGVGQQKVDVTTFFHSIRKPNAREEETNKFCG